MKNRTPIKIKLPASKSISNRVLIIKALLNEDFTNINNLSDAKDTRILQRILTQKDKNTFDVGHAGTAMRFLTAYFAMQNGNETILKGSERMHQRPIKTLVNALKNLGVEIEYLAKNGFPPIKIKGTSIKKNTVNLDANISSQYISALLLVAPLLKNGLKINLIGKLVSKPYVQMTIAIMQQFGVKVSPTNRGFEVEAQKYLNTNTKIESDWSSASYWYEYVALSKSAVIELQGLQKNSIQGDAVLPKLFSPLGVETTWTKDGIIIYKKEQANFSTNLTFDLENTPDLAQTLVCTCAGLNLNATFTGLSTLVIKETNRLIALKNELQKFGIPITIEGNNTIILKEKKQLSRPKESIKTYEDHRMAMAFAPLSLVVGKLYFDNPNVVEKSYPAFWEEMKKVTNRDKDNSKT